MASLSYSQQLATVLGIFVRPMNEELGWSRTAITGAQSAARFVEGITSPFVGRYIDHHGPRGPMIVGGLIAGLGFIFLGRVESLAEWYFFRSFVISLGFAAMGYMVTSVAVSNWFVRKRGRAMAIAGMGSSVTSTILPPIAVLAMAQWGWRPLWVVFGVLTWITVVIPAAIWMRRRPEDMGLRTDGDQAVPGAQGEDGASALPHDAGPVSRTGQAAPGAQAEAGASALPQGTGPAPQVWANEPLEPVWTRREALRTSTFWHIIATFAITGLAIQGINISLIPLVEDHGYSPETAALALSMRAFSLLVLSPFAGFAADRFNPKFVRSSSFALQAVAAFLFLVGGSLVTLYAAIFVYALGSGISQVSSEMIWADAYGRLTLGTVRSLGAPILTAISALGPVFMNGIYDLTGSYRLAFGIFIALFLASSVGILFLRTPRPQRFARASEFRPEPARTATSL